MTSETDICNRALGLAQTRNQIASMQEQSNEANQCALYYAPVRDSALRAAHWGFARRTVTLSLLKSQPGTPEYTGTVPTTWNNTLPPPEWLYTYAWPLDCIAPRKIQRQFVVGASGVPIFSYGWQSISPRTVLPPVRYEVGSDTNAQGQDVKVIHCNESQALMVYTHLITAPDLWDKLFEDTVVAALSGYLANALTGDKALVKMRIEEANQKLMEARVRDADEGLTIHDPVPDFMAVRSIGGLVGGGWQPTPYGPLFGTI
jgi:hypothetical protein